MDKNTAFSKVAWVNDRNFCILSDKEFNGQNFPHFIFLFDAAGNEIHDPVKVKTKYSIQDDYVLVLGTTIFFLDSRENDMNAHVFSITNVVRVDGINHDSLNIIFYIGKSKENKKLNEPAYSFKAYRGVNGQKALLTYNNDYKDPYKEGFRYRTLDAAGNLTREDTLDLPYLDRECNIDDVIYDDKENRVYLLCDLFSIPDKKERVFKNSFIGVYDLNLKTYQELSRGLSSFYKCKMQHVYKKDHFAFTGLRVDRDSYTDWVASFSVIQKEPLEVIHSSSFNVKPEIAADFFGVDRKAEKEHIHPVHFLESENGSFSVGWTKFYTLNQMAQSEKSDGGTVMAAGIMFGLLGAAIASAATSGSGEIHKDLNRVLWLNYLPKSYDLEQTATSSSLASKKYYAYSYAAFLKQDTVCWLMNKPLEEKSKYSSVYVSKMTDSKNSGDKNVFEKLSALHVNMVYPGSLYTFEGKNYFVGEYDPDMDKINHPSTSSSKYYLIEIE